MQMEAREEVCLQLLKDLPSDNYVLIGGYATSAFDFPRFSVDLDLVIKKETADHFREILKQHGFHPREDPVEPVKDIYGGQFQRFEQQINGFTASVDLLINSVISRQTGSSYSFAYLHRHSDLREVSGFSSHLQAQARVANREMLIALKANSMRLADQRDIIALCYGEVDFEQVVSHLRRCPQDVIQQNINTLLENVGSDTYRDSIKGVFMLSDQVHDRLVARIQDAFARIQADLKSL